MPTLLFVATLAAVLPLLSSDVSFEDSAEYTAAAAVFGQPHPSGYPLYVALAHVFSRLPIGTVPWRVAFFSALCAAAAATMLFVAARRLMARRGRPLPLVAEVLMAACFLQLAATLTWLSQAAAAEVNAFHAALFAAVTLALVPREGDKNWKPYAACLFFGLSCANHLYLSLAAAPAFALALAVAEPRTWRSGRVMAACAVAFALGLLPYAFIPLMSRGAYVYMPAEGALSVFRMVARSSYGDVTTHGWNKFGFVAAYVTQLAVELGPLVLAAAAFGAWRLAGKKDRRRRAVLLWAAGPILAVPVVALFYGMDFSAQASYIYRAYAVGGMAALAFLAACGFAEALSLVPRRLTAALVLVSLALPAATYASARATAAAYADPFPGANARAILAPLPRGAVLIAADEGIVKDTELFGLSYLQSVEGFRRDVTVINEAVERPLVIPPLPQGYLRLDLTDRRRALIEAVRGDATYAGRPLYATFAVEGSMPGLRSVSNGAVYRLTDQATPAPEAPAPQPPIDLRLAGRHYALGAVASHALYARAARLQDEQGKREALAILLEAMRLDPRPFSQDYQDYLAHRGASLVPGQVLE
jgi:hypothetical protein